jgi:hypothetical protein
MFLIFEEFFIIIMFKIPKLRVSNKYDSLFMGIPRFRHEDLREKEEIGSGGFGKVVKASHFQVTVVVKIFFDENEDIISNMAKEVRLHQGLRHSNIAEFMSVCVHPPSLMKKPMEERNQLWTDARKEGQALRKKHSDDEKAQRNLE